MFGCLVCADRDSPLSGGCNVPMCSQSAVVPMYQCAHSPLWSQCTNVLTGRCGPNTPMCSQPAVVPVHQCAHSLLWP